MQTTSRHLLLEYHGCDQALLDDSRHVESLLRTAAAAARATIVESVFHTFSPQGVTGIVVVEESHFSVHTWPEAGYAAIDIFTCGDCDGYAAHEIIKTGLKAITAELMHVERGRIADSFGMRVTAHTLDTPRASTKTA